MHMKKFNNISGDYRTFFFNSIRKEEELDESTFNIWKTELQKELPTFWEEMTSRQKR